MIDELKKGDRVRRIRTSMLTKRGVEYPIGSQWTVESANDDYVYLVGLTGAWDLNNFELIEEKMCTCNEQSGVCSECAKNYKGELTPGKKYRHEEWLTPYTFLTKTSKGKLVFEDLNGNAFSSRYIDPRSFEEVKEKKKGWINFYSNTVLGPYSSRELADKCAGGYRIACIEVEYYEGQGL